MVEIFFRLNCAHYYYFGFSIMSTSNTAIARIISVNKMPGEGAQQDFIHSVPKTESGAIDLTKAERIAEGGTHILYRFSDAPFVIKLMRQNPNPKELDELEKKYAVLYDCFDKNGKQRCIREQHITCQVLLPGKEPQSAALSIVPYEKCFKSKVKFDFKIEPVELDVYLMEHNQDLFDKAHKALIHKDGAGIDFELNDYAIIDEHIGAILQRLDRDPQLKEVMIEFLDHFRDFYQRTNIILDAMGYENILFFKDEHGDWQFKVGSVIKHDTGKYTQELFDTLHSGKEVDLTGFVNFTHAYFSPANIRAVNVCAMKLGLEPVIHDVTIDSKDLFRISQELSVGERLLAYARHGDFEKMDKILQKPRGELSFNLRDSWAYSRIADEYIKHGQPPTALRNYLNTVSKLPVILPENKDDAKRVEDARTAIIDRKNMHDKKIMLHGELTTYLTNKNGDTALSLAQKSGAKETTELLLKTEINPQDQLFATLRSLKEYGLLLKSQGVSKGQIAIDLAADLKLQADVYFQKEAMPTDLKQFQDKFSLLLNSKNREMSEYRTSWSTIIANIAIALTGIGALFLVGQLIYSTATQGRPLFFFQKNQTTSEEKVGEVRQAMLSLSNN